MPRYTVLRMVQDILSAGSGDQVSDINDTEESEQVLGILRGTYFDIIEEKHSKWEHLKEMTTLEASGDVLKPTHMKLNADVYNIWFLKYNRRQATGDRDNYQDLNYLTPDEFLGMTNARDETADNHQQVTDFSGIKITIRNDLPPQWYTSFDNDNFVMDSFDIALETTLQAAKTQCYVSKIPTWTDSNTFIPDLPPQAFSLLLDEAYSMYWNDLKQLPNAKAEQKATRQRRNMKQNSHQINRGIPARHPGRRSRK